MDTFEAAVRITKRALGESAMKKTLDMLCIANIIFNGTERNGTERIRDNFARVRTVKLDTDAYAHDRGGSTTPRRSRARFLIGDGVP